MSLPSASRIRLPLCLLVVLAAAAAGVRPAAASTITAIRYSSNAARTRVVVDLSTASEYSHRSLPDPPRVVMELSGAALAPGVAPQPVGDGYVARIRINDLQSGRVQVVLDLEKPLDYSTFTLEDPYRIVIDVKHAGPPAPAGPAKSGTGGEPGGGAPSVPPPPPVVNPIPPPRGDWVIAVDAGHGGQDDGAHYHGTDEKDVTLELAREVTAEINRRPGMKAFMVRKGDYYIPLYTRRAIAEKDSADLFVSLHCNASSNQSAAGTEVYFLSLKGASNEAAKELAKKENQVDEQNQVAPESQDLDQILFDMTQTDVLAKSQLLAESCLKHLFDLGTVYDRGVKQAGFVVLKSPRIPSVLVEAAFLSNKGENKLLRSGKWQGSFAEYLTDGIQAYCGNVDRAEHTSRGGAREEPGKTRSNVIQNPRRP